MKEILLADDDTHFRIVVQYYLEKEGYKVVSCTSGEEALDEINKSYFQTAILDYKMGGISGLDVAKAADSKTPPIPIIILTAYPDAFVGDLPDGLVKAVLTKPINLRTLVEALEKIEEDSQFLPNRKYDRNK